MNICIYMSACQFRPRGGGKYCGQVWIAKETVFTEYLVTMQGTLSMLLKTLVSFLPVSLSTLDSEHDNAPAVKSPLSTTSIPAYALEYGIPNQSPPAMLQLKSDIHSAPSLALQRRRLPALRHRPATQPHHPDGQLDGRRRSPLPADPGQRGCPQ